MKAAHRVRVKTHKPKKTAQEKFNEIVKKNRRAINEGKLPLDYETHLKTEKHRVSEVKLVQPQRLPPPYERPYRGNVEAMRPRELPYRPQDSELYKLLTEEIEALGKDPDFVTAQPGPAPDNFDKAASFARNFVKGVVDYLDHVKVTVKEKVDAYRRRD